MTVTVVGWAVPQAKVRWKLAPVGCRSGISDLPAALVSTVVDPAVMGWASVVTCSREGQHQRARRGRRAGVPDGEHVQRGLGLDLPPHPLAFPGGVGAAGVLDDQPLEATGGPHTEPLPGEHDVCGLLAQHDGWRYPGQDLLEYLSPLP